MQSKLNFYDVLHPCPQTKGIDVVSTLQHFAIVTYAVHPSRLEHLLPKRFKLDTVEIEGETKALLSVVPFYDLDFRPALLNFPKLSMGQTNYRIYVVDTKTGEKVVWFIGTTLDSWSTVVPAWVWKLPWYRGKIDFDCNYDEKRKLYRDYSMTTTSDWAPAHLKLTQEENIPFVLEGFTDEESALAFLTHPLTGYYHRRDTKVGTYAVWHERLQVKPAKLISAHFELLSRMNILTQKEQQHPHSVLVQAETEFTIFLPPKIVRK